MKNKWMLLVIALIPALCLADVAPVIPDWFSTVLAFLSAVPVVGPVLAVVLPWVGMVAAIFTALATALAAIANSLKLAGQALGFVSFVEKVEALYQQVWPYLAWLSVYNVKKQ